MWLCLAGMWASSGRVCERTSGTGFVPVRGWLRECMTCAHPRSRPSLVVVSAPPRVMPDLQVDLLLFAPLASANAIHTALFPLMTPLPNSLVVVDVGLVAVVPECGNNVCEVRGWRDAVATLH
jgi:hypothetical protein